LHSRSHPGAAGLLPAVRPRKSPARCSSRYASGGVPPRPLGGTEMKAPSTLFVYLSASSLALAVVTTQGQSQPHDPPTEALTGFDNLTNGFVSQEQFDLARAAFEQRDGIGQGLGPVYNAQSCAECHQSPVTGAISQITELRAGHYDAASNTFTDHP